MEPRGFDPHSSRYSERTGRDFEQFSASSDPNHFSTSRLPASNNYSRLFPSQQQHPPTPTSQRREPFSPRFQNPPNSPHQQPTLFNDDYRGPSSLAFTPRPHYESSANSIISSHDGPFTYPSASAEVPF